MKSVMNVGYKWYKWCSEKLFVVLLALSLRTALKMDSL